MIEKDLEEMDGVSKKNHKVSNTTEYYSGILYDGNKYKILQPGVNIF
jgi:hypothetical protein